MKSTIGKRAGLNRSQEEKKPSASPFGQAEETAGRLEAPNTTSP